MIKKLLLFSLLIFTLNAADDSKQNGREDTVPEIRPVPGGTPPLPLPATDHPCGLWFFRERN